MNRKIRYAVVRLGHVAQTAVLPAFKHAENCQLVALVTGNREKKRELGERYGVNAYTYDDLEEAFEKEQVDAAYVATPNIFHREHTERAAHAGVHVLCEKPMATTQEDCEAMIRAAEENDVKLMIAYRLHFNDANLHAVRVAQSGDLGRRATLLWILIWAAGEGGQHSHTKSARRRHAVRYWHLLRQRCALPLSRRTDRSCRADRK